MASYHLSVKTIKRSAGRTATAAAAYRVGERIECQREGRIHDYTRKQGIEETFIVAPEHAPAWAQDRSALWNAAEASETRRNSVTAREWELALPSEISAEDRSQITRKFAEELVSRYGVAVDVAIHAPHREGDQRNHHAHVLTSTRKLEAEGFTAKTRVLDSAKTGGVEIEQMRGLWAELQNRALERVGEVERVDHRSLEKQRETALDRGDKLSAEELDRDPELKLGPAANSMERRAKAMAAREGREYVPVTERGAVVHAARQARAAFRDMRERLELARETYGIEREAGQGRVSAGLAALRAATSKERSGGREKGDFRDRLAQVVGRSRDQDDTPKPEGRNYARERLKEIMEKDDGRDGQTAVHKLDGHSEYELGQEAGRGERRPSMKERLEGVLNRPRERLEIEDTPKKDREAENEREIDRDTDRDRGLSH
ncbi:MobQ family relaxase [Sulfitobacter delicatus]|jgi:MobA/MobL family.|uniref:MobA/MobL family protein n=1 Tax=Sulfitobacter delicatus TaxID=218672 RepID=A0A1G7ZML6_9RHOB|nr:MobQ family relaxase [Sulfitobacter delicatus]MAQ45115.1 molybdopterin-guanine dinucleotide biosynthesis protein MobA [Actibacterium sp.]SDH09817.1 MobA/MobL family protein [Sulfitobacter delicatus]|tara:strand:- start:2386 stop:3681 length:1296 start_codon:yes stop_codon:yes gene_type:complete